MTHCGWIRSNAKAARKRGCSCTVQQCLRCATSTGKSNEEQMIIKANGVGASYAIPNESVIAEMTLGVSGHRVIVDTGFRRVEDSL